MQRAAVVALACGLAITGCTTRPLPEHGRVGPASDDRVRVRIETDAADAVLALLADRTSAVTPAAARLERLFASEGYRRLKRREAAMGRAFEDAEFQAFLASDTLLARANLLAATLEEWKRVDLSAAVGLALAYLPADARLRATVYPVIKPRSNSFVFDVGTDSAAIFLFLDPAVSAARLQNTLAHELHHIGYAAACAGTPDRAAPEGVRQAVRWMGAFGEGLAMLAAAGGPYRHPHAVSDSAERARWDHDVSNAAEDMRRLERFFLDVIDGRLAEADSVRAAAMQFFGEQGPWYTVGWVMASTVERVYGRPRLIDILCEPHHLLRDYNAAAAEYGGTAEEALPLWSEALLARLER